MPYLVCKAGGPGDHDHVAYVDPRTGNGRTDPGPDGHVHEIIAREVKPAGPDGHGHDLDCLASAL